MFVPSIVVKEAFCPCSMVQVEEPLQVPEDGVRVITELLPLTRILNAKLLG
jgi:hypothetical protein